MHRGTCGAGAEASLAGGNCPRVQRPRASMGVPRRCNGAKAARPLARAQSGRWQRVVKGRSLVAPEASGVENSVTYLRGCQRCKRSCMQRSLQICHYNRLAGKHPLHIHTCSRSFMPRSEYHTLTHVFHELHKAARQMLMSRCLCLFTLCHSRQVCMRGHTVAIHAAGDLHSSSA